VWVLQRRLVGLPARPANAKRELTRRPPRFPPASSPLPNTHALSRTPSENVIRYLFIFFKDPCERQMGPSVYTKRGASVKIANYVCLSPVITNFSDLSASSPTNPWSIVLLPQRHFLIYLAKPGHEGPRASATVTAAGLMLVPLCCCGELLLLLDFFL
jgi:hypothetical protein